LFMADGSRSDNKTARRKKKINLEYECDAFGCRPKSTIKGSSTFQGSGNKGGQTRAVPKFDWEVEKIPAEKSAAAPQTDVMLDIEEIRPGDKHNQLFTGTYQQAQKENALAGAAKASSTFTPIKFPKFQEESRQSLMSGGADPRTISPTAKPGESTAISKVPMTKAQEQTMKFRLGPDYDIAKEGKVMSRTKYRTDPKTRERVPVKKIWYDNNTINETNLETGVTKITDLTTGKEPKYTKAPDFKVEKKEIVKTPSSESTVTEEGNADVTKAELKAAAAASKKPGYFSKEAKRNRRRKRGSRYAGGAGGGRR
jgi:hypothetical protein